MIRVAAMVSMLMLTAFANSACGNVCAKGDDNCICEGTGDCEWSCPGGECAFQSSTMGNTSFECEAGKCSLSNSGQGTATLECKGGGCSVTSTGQGDTTVNCEDGDCSMACNGQGTCTINQCADCVCSEGELTAECSVNG